MRKRYSLPRSWISATFEHVDTNMLDARILFEKLRDILLDRSGCYSWKSEDKIHTDILESNTLKNIECPACMIFFCATDQAKTLDIERLDTETQPIHSDFSHSLHKILRDIFRIRLECYLEVGRWGIFSKASNNLRNLYGCQNRRCSSAKIDALY